MCGRCSVRLGLIVATIAVSSVAMGAELRMNWQGHGSAGVVVQEMAVGDQAVVEYRLTLMAGDTLSGVFFANEPAGDVTQVGVTATPANWSESSTAGTALGTGGQQLNVFAQVAADVVSVAGETLVATQTVQLVGGAVGDEIEVTFSLAQLGVIDENGSFYNRTPTGSAFQDEVGFFHLGTGSPGYTQLGITDVREPLIVRVVQAGTGGGGGGGGGGGNTNANDNGAGGNTNMNANDNGAGGNANDNSPGDNTNANDGGGNDNGAGGNTNMNANDNGAGGNANDNSPGDNANGNDGGGNTNTNANDNSSGGNSPPRGLCGLGFVSMLPLNLLGLAVIQARSRRRSRRG